MKKNCKWFTVKNTGFVFFIFIVILAIIIPGNISSVIMQYKIEWDIKHKYNLDKSVTSSLINHLNIMKADIVYEYLTKSNDMDAIGIVISKCVVIDKHDMLPFLEKIVANNKGSKNDKYFNAQTAIIAINNQVKLPRIDMKCSEPYYDAMKAYISYSKKVKKEWLRYGKKYLDAIALKALSQFSWKNNNGSYSIGVYTPYYFGDLVEYESLANGKGQGFVEAITVDEDGTVSYLLKCNLGNGSFKIQGGIYPSDIKKLILRK